MATLTFFFLAVTILTLGMAENLAKKDTERFHRLMSCTLRLLLTAGAIFSFFEILSEFHVIESVADKMLAVSKSITPITFMAAVSFLFLCSLTTEKWWFKAGQRNTSHVNSAK
ncbi:hypothetical protein V1226_08875 [Lachnospiraceae bacterium JLR.KK009]|mgnify:FL=1|jgi:hypothetical protein|nr:hypothetical protein C810_01595 [Lachnospiraceae bacterium A2]MCI8707587.1 hypothetical protein [Lachnospiraceae bacterium]MCI8884179.1 hypothetical protein [Lachnospiraceae bacterium]